MSIDYSKSRESAKNFSREAGFHEIDQSTLEPAFVGYSQKIGSVNVDQLILGTRLPNVQAAISDIANLYAVPVGDVRITTEAISPAGSGQIQRVTVTGTAVKTVVKIYGVDVKVTKGQNQDAIATAIKATLNELAAEDIAIKTVQAVSGRNNQFDVKFIDTNNHADYLWTDDDVIVSAENLTEAKPGYGQWAQIGHQDVDNGAGVTTRMYYWKRTA